MIDEAGLSERDICTKFITPALVRAGWDIATQVREEVTFTAGRVIVRGTLAYRSKRRKRADFLLYHGKHLPLAVIEAKDPTHSVGAGMQQALAYAETLDLPFAFSSNGSGFLFHDRTGRADKVETALSLDAFPSPGALWQRYLAWKGLDAKAEPVVTEPYHDDGSGKEPRYYQRIAINRTVEAIARGQKRILLVMATGTGKTYTAFQILWRLRRAGACQRVLFLADRNILVDQTRVNDFKPFHKVMTKVQNRTVDKAYEVYLALYQAVTGTEPVQEIYRQFSRDFFDLVVVDECHRGSARDDSAWREVLEYFASATQIGLTATPKETKDVSNSDYFGAPVYTYSLHQGIDDGFLAPYKVVRVDLDRDLAGWRPSKGKRDDHGLEIEDRIYNQRDFDRELVLTQRTDLVARKVTEMLRGTDRYAKTIVFCEDVDHAERMRQALVNQNPDLVLESAKYVMRITGDNEEGKQELDGFIDPETRYPVIATTSRLMSTGVDAQTCKLIVLDRRIESLAEFKQIIGRGTRLREDFGKLYFTIMDFRKATQLFADPTFDGEPVQIYEPDDDDPVVPPDPSGDDDDSDRPDPAVPGGDEGDGDDDDGDDEGPGPRPRPRYVVGDVTVSVVGERVQYYDAAGKLVTESLRDYSRKAIRTTVRSLDDFLKRWSDADQRDVLIEELREQGVLLEALADEVGRDYPPFDLICHVAFDRPPLTRRERVAAVRKRDYFATYGDKARAVLEALLDKYADEGVEHIDRIDVLRVQPLDKLGTPVDLVKRFGGRTGYVAAARALEEELYRDPEKVA